ncbi:carbon-nitrogen hydrolase family protein [Halochromatium glycolicum]|jgi:nitrilase|uniref:Acyltransferase n=1 Tax=Halochromatium glycolicum TaxID=85075 RepID=A0AAJ0U1D6_9GAMM|nr:carbon-nitrogen hydrolase family protein [Halochromatium glycolicum]MBK1703448.1 acyltransferase [Halochromatium glycolicum]
MSEAPKVAAIQMASGPNTTANLIETERLIGLSAEAGAGLIVLPENFAFMGQQDRDLLRLAEDDGNGQLQDFLAKMARRYGVWLVGGTVPIRTGDPERVRSAALIYNAQGDRVARYDKLHLFDAVLPSGGERYQESATIAPGEQSPVVDTPFGRLGVLICYDLRFPETARRMVDSGLEILAVPAAFTAQTGKAHWETLVRARAVENLAYVIAAAQGGFHLSGRETYGHSMVVDPWGNVLAEVARGVGQVCCPLDRDRQVFLRKTFPVLEHRRLKCR